MVTSAVRIFVGHKTSCTLIKFHIYIPLTNLNNEKILAFDISDCCNNISHTKLLYREGIDVYKHIQRTFIGNFTIEQFSLISLWLTPAIAPFNRPGILIFSALKPVLPNSVTASSKIHYSLLKSVMEISISACLVIIHKHSWCGVVETS